MIVVGFNGFTHTADVFARHFRRSGVDRYRLLGHDAGAAVFVDGELVAAVEEERLNREKKTSDFPARALRWALREAGAGLGDVDVFAFPWAFTPEVVESQLRGLLASPLALTAKFEQFSRLGELYRRVTSEEAIRSDFAERTGYEIPDGRLKLVPHHLAHLMCGHYLAGGGEAAFLVSDGRAETFSSVMGEIDDHGHAVFEECSVDIANSLAMLYSKVTRYLGFVPNNDEYKVMGLASYAEPAGDNPLLDQVVELMDDGRYELRFRNELLDTQSYYALFDEVFGRAAAPSGSSADQADFAFKAQVARWAQETVEAVTAHQLAALEKRTDRTRLLLEGGLALNCVNNSKLLAASGQFQDLRVSFGASDVGVAIGAGHHAVRELGERPVHRTSPYLGPAFGPDDIEAALREYSGRVWWRQCADGKLAEDVAGLLCEKVVIGWFQGRMEYGPRALGNRSILANPGFDDIQDIINTRVKRREPFRPFAPVLLEEDAADVLDLGKKTGSPYMTFVFPVREPARALLPGACHVDGTARAQTVTDLTNPPLAALLRAFRDRTGLPCLINTSFNVAGEPIVCTPRDALECFLGTEIDYLVLGDVIVSKAQSGPSTRELG
ncbi:MULTISPECIES: carbamoyltransferase C-terminal domain-containing protein [Streptomyces]|uniref:Carbamoyltransferase n=1 Tax=Streptomyces sviceus (strain ATCC 29083 / DSM 924 / JCM 4929 / NBRC 13980 / NCIMB 11184 / NRRL 5439 / UC 5370) TaxID=463191 RepID=B5HT93_STRX2|nr:MULTISPECIES: carbamoyltransferase C-terminal domain-containing protein [Streptomyces]EDY56048.1 carbamoyltransferase [Streptomyces sviceus ATCC 29083]MYT09019.1 carbamoyltransferase [Streptomyces sp. SID5470]